ncbi:hypothetical protein GALMADRAFT_1129830 [Galerina marginata CBS 339.88]|uniref:Uncharacterized protein n=1 Tax=Galerina marginata (strain CBS 339.88) TaxID=685588 RepID=A0A067S8I1_GALM3|nr:hypothetical protein GALMADRAFT_1129830 [Galerina marginata CBS 339.88]
MVYVLLIIHEYLGDNADTVRSQRPFDNTPITPSFVSRLSSRKLYGFRSYRCYSLFFVSSSRTRRPGRRFLLGSTTSWHLLIVTPCLFRPLFWATGVSNQSPVTTQDIQNFVSARTASAFKSTSRAS